MEEDTLCGKRNGRVIFQPTCMMCFEKSLKMKKSLCDHVACRKCWDELFHGRDVALCSMCEIQVKRADLINV